MAKRQQRLTASASQNIGAALGRVAARIDAWSSQRAEIARDLEQLIGQAQAMLRSIGQAASGVSAGDGSRRKGGRPKGYKMSAATRAKLKAAWKRRKAAGATAGKQG